MPIGDTVAAADNHGMVEGYDAADPPRGSTFSLRDDWMGRELGQQGRTVEDYGALIEYLVSECRRHGASIQLGAAVTVIDAGCGRLTARCYEAPSSRPMQRSFPCRFPSCPKQWQQDQLRTSLPTTRERPLRWRC